MCLVTRLRLLLVRFLKDTPPAFSSSGDRLFFFANYLLLVWPFLYCFNNKPRSLLVLSWDLSLEFISKHLAPSKNLIPLIDRLKCKLKQQERLSYSTRKT